MVDRLWSLFPRMLERNINGLLDQAGPNALKAFQIYKTCQNEGLWDGTVEDFSRHLETFFSQPRAERRKSDFDRYLRHPMDHDTYSRFHLDFRTAIVDETSLEEIASWAHNLIRVSKKTTSAFMSLEMLSRTLRKITNPTIFEKAQDIEFSDFCAAWKQTVFKYLGYQRSNEFEEVLTELHWLNSELKKAESQPAIPPPPPVIALTQTEIDWTMALRVAAYKNEEAPKFPLSRGPEKEALKKLERVAQLYTSSLSSQHPEVKKNKDRIRATLIDRCDKLLGIAAPNH